MITIQQIADALLRVVGGKTVPAPVAAPPICPRCDGHGCVEIYSTSDEYGAPCPVCKGADAYHAKIERREGCIPTELRYRILPQTEKGS